MPAKTKAVKGSKTTSAGAFTAEGVDSACVAFVFKLAKEWVTEGKSGDSPGLALEAFELLRVRGVTVR